MKGYSLHVGVSRVKGVPDHKYGKDPLPLDGPETDAIFYRGLMKENGVKKPKILLSSKKNATSCHFFQALEDIIKATKKDQKNNEEAYVVITFSGHGATFKSKKDSVSRVEFLCFQDRMVLEHEIKRYLLQLPSNIKCFIVLDACYAFGIKKDKKFRKNLSPENSNSRVKSLNAVEVGHILKQNNLRAYYIDLIHTTPAISSSTFFRSDICFLAACDENNLTRDAPKAEYNSIFTSYIKDLVETPERYQNYNEFHYILSEVSTYRNLKGPIIHGAYSKFFMKNKPFQF